MKKILTLGVILTSIISTSYASVDLTNKMDLLNARMIIDTAKRKNLLNPSDYYTDKTLITINGNYSEILWTNKQEENCALFYDCIKLDDNDTKKILDLGYNNVVNYNLEEYQQYYSDYYDKIKKLLDNKLQKIHSAILKKAYNDYKKGLISQKTKLDIAKQYDNYVKNITDTYTDYIAWKKINKEPIYDKVYFNYKNYKCQMKDFVLHYNNKEYCNYYAESEYLKTKTLAKAKEYIKDFISFVKKTLKR